MLRLDILGAGFLLGKTWTDAIGASAARATIGSNGWTCEFSRFERTQPFLERGDGTLLVAALVWGLCGLA